VELQAHGHTADRDTPTSFVQDAKDVVALLRHLRIPKAHIMGFSNGGQTAMQIGISHPEVVEKLIIASAFYKKDGAQPWLWQGMAQATLDNMPGPFQDAYLAINPSQEGLLAMFKRDKERMLNFQDWPDEEVRGIQAPTLVLTGNDDVATPEHSVAMSRLLPNGKLVILPGGHGECLGDILFPDSYLPGVTAQVVQGFLG
jgi:pimeloyl-ACP methyl ester carboxylesterase